MKVETDQFRDPPNGLHKKPRGLELSSSNKERGERNEYTAFENCLKEGGGGSIAGKNQE